MPPPADGETAMQSLKTMYRIVVMGVTLAIVVMGWRLYGPSAAKTKSLVLSAMEWTEARLRGTEHVAEAKPQAQSIAAAPLAAPPVAAAANPPALLTVSAEQPGDGALRSNTATGDDRLKKLLAQLDALGAREPKLSTWGDSGKLYRFCCQASWGSSPQFSRHFESIAVEPAAAVEQVLAEVDAWRTANSGGMSLR
jgi:hypothetical protein